MRHPLRLACCAALVVLFFAGAYVLFPSVLTDFGLNLRDWWKGQENLDEQLRREKDLEQRRRRPESYERAQDQICLDLAEGRLTLVEAAKRLGQLPDPPEHFWEQIRLSFAGATDDERMCRRAIELACGLLHGQPGRQQALRQRLERELNNLPGP